jgi:glycerol-3-phosphate dehydrogenase
MMRDFRRLADTRFDLVVVGAGLYGAIAAWDATLRGLSVALVDKDDFGSGTSFNNLKTLHGGLRSLQTLNFSQMRLFIRERRAFARIAPHLVGPLAFIVPTYLSPKRSASAMRVVLAVNDLVSRDRHEGIADPGLTLPPSRVVSRDECLRLNPLIAPRGVTGGAVWHDYQMHNADRMTFAFVQSAAEAGAVVVNYAAATRVLLKDGRVEGVGVADRLSGTEIRVNSPAVLNATGPWARTFLQTLGRPATTPAPRLSRAMNLITRGVVRHACGGLAHGRFLFLVPWRDVTLVGTSHDAHDGNPETLAVTRWDLEAFLADVREAFPRAGLTAADVRLVHRGLLPMVSGHDTHVKLLRESAVVDHRQDGAEGLVSMFGVRYTTARFTAARAIDTVFQVRGDETPPACRTADTPVSGGTIANKDSFVRAVLLRDVAGVSQETLQRLAITYGTTYDAVLQIVRDHPEFAAPLGEHCPVTGAEILHATRAEAAVKLSDALIRRTEAGSGGHPGTDAIARGAAIMAMALNWDDARVQKEIAEVEEFYRLPS